MLIKSTRVVALLCCVGALTACSSLPASGPTANDIVKGTQASQLGYRIVDVTPKVLDVLAASPKSSMSVLPGAHIVPENDLIGVGDVLSVSVFETGSGLFSGNSSGAGGVQAGASEKLFPRVQVNRDGCITIPYVGPIAVVGRTPDMVDSVLQERLRSKSLDPQVVVNVTGNITNTVIVSGDVRSPGRYPLSLAREGLLDVVSLAGGPTHSSSDVEVRLRRGGTTETARLDDEVADDTPLLAGDRITLSYQPRSFTVFGETEHVSQIKFDSSQVSLAEGIARSGGPSDALADPASVYLFRYERPDVVAALWGEEATAPVPVIYQIDLLKADSYFFIQRMNMQDKDVIYIASARVNRLEKFLSLLGLAVAPVVTTAQINNL